MRHDIGPWYVRLNYQSNGHPHVMQFSVRPSGTPAVGDPCDVLLKGGTTMSLSAAVGTLVAAMLDIFNTGSSFGSWDLFHKATPTSDPVWYNAGQLVGAVGTSSEAAKTAVQCVVTYRTSLGGHYRFQLMETIANADEVVGGASWAADPLTADINSVLTGDDAFIVGRDGGWLVSAIRRITKENDKLRRKYKGL